MSIATRYATDTGAEFDVVGTQEVVNKDLVQVTWPNGKTSRKHVKITSTLISESGPKKYHRTATIQVIVFGKTLHIPLVGFECKMLKAASTSRTRRKVDDTMTVVSTGEE